MAETKIPLVTLVLGSVIAGCKEPIVGDWNLVDIELEGDGYNIDFDGTTYSFTYDGEDDTCGSYAATDSMTITGQLVVDDALVSRFSLDITYDYSKTSDDCPTLTSTDSDEGADYVGDTVAQEDGSYTIYLSEGGDDLELSCRVRTDNTTMDCDGETDEDDMELELVFAKDGK